MTQESENVPARRVDDKRADVPLNWSDASQTPALVPVAPIPTDVMIDIETLGTTPGSAILSIGAVVFGPEGLGDTFYAPILLTSCIEVGLTIDPNTVTWWMQQSEEARKAAFRDDADSLRDVLEQFTSWIELVGAERPWCHGATFDVPLLEAAFKACGIAPPWKFYNVRDTRTLYDLANVKVDRTKGTHHNALVDALAQAEAAAKAMRILDVHKAINAQPAPAAATMLTDERIIEMHDSMFPRVAFERDKIMGNVVSFARAIEREVLAHAGNAVAAEFSEGDIPADAPRAFAKRYSTLLEENRKLKADLAHAGVTAEPADREKLLRSALDAAEKWSQQEHLHARDIGRGGPGLPKKVERAERDARAAIKALAESGVAQVPAAEVRAQEPSIQQVIYAIRRAMDRAHVPSPYRAEILGYFCNEWNALAQQSTADKASEVRAAEWISVEDRLPKIGEEVLIWCGYRICGYRSDDKHDPENHNGWVIDFDNGRASAITHWMPLPAAPSTADSANTGALGEKGAEA